MGETKQSKDGDAIEAAATREKLIELYFDAPGQSAYLTHVLLFLSVSSF